MKPAQPLTYTNVTPKAYDQFKLVAKGHGYNISGNKDTGTYDGIGVAVQYDPDKQILSFQTHPPFWLPDAVVSGHIHDLVSEAMRNTDEFQAQQQNRDRIEAQERQAKAASDREKNPPKAVDQTQPDAGRSHK